MSDSKIEFLKHLRTVHFTLVITAFALIVTVNIQSVSKAEIALGQFHEISSAIEKWKIFDLSVQIDEEVLKGEFGKFRDSGILKFVTYVQDFDVENFWEVKWKSTAWSLNYSNLWNRIESISPPTNLQEFKLIWEKLSEAYVAYPNEFTPIIYDVEKGRLVDEYAYLPESIESAQEIGLINFFTDYGQVEMHRSKVF